MSPTRTASSASLANADWLNWPETVDVFSALGAQGHEVRAVGGAVRDVLLGRIVQDVDIATTALPKTVMELAAAADLKAIPTGIDHGTVTVIAGGHAFEVTTLRKDVETYGRRASVSYTDDWEADASRRDFTINALYADADGKLFDPLGGCGDLEERHIRFIGDARARVREDYLRILRFFRFNAELEAENFDAQGLEACVSEQAGLKGLSGERVCSEVLRLLNAKGAYRAIVKMFDYGLLVPLLGGVPHLTRLEHLIAIEAELGTEPDAILRLGALCVEVPEDALRLADRLRLSNAERSHLEHASGYRAMSVALDEARVKGAIYTLGREGCRTAAFMAWAASGDAVSDAAWRGLVTRIQDLSIPEFPLQGSDIVKLGVPEGPGVGEILKQAKERWMQGRFAAEKKELLEFACQIAKVTSKKA